MSTPLSNQDTLTGPKGGRIRGSPLYNISISADEDTSDFEITMDDDDDDDDERPPEYSQASRFTVRVQETPSNPATLVCLCVRRMRPGSPSP